MRLDADGTPVPTGETETLAADALVLALGQDVDLSLLANVPGLQIRDGVVQVDERMMTAARACSPAATWCPMRATSRWPWATARRRRATSTPGCAARSSSRRHGRRRRLRADEPVVLQRCTAHRAADARVVRRQSSFDEVQAGLDERNALHEARRCLSCGNCFECDNCYGMCPDNAWSSSAGHGLPGSTTTTARAAASAPRSALRRDHDGRRDAVARTPAGGPDRRSRGRWSAHRADHRRTSYPTQAGLRFG